MAAFGPSWSFWLHPTAVFFVLETPMSVLAVSQKLWRPKGDIQLAKMHGLMEGRENTSELRGDHVTVMH